MKSIVYFFNLLFVFVLGKFTAIEPIIEPLELILKSTDNEGLFHCNGHVNLKNQTQQLTASIENLNINSPKFAFKVEQINSTTIRIRIKPNGYIGINRISCHWSNNLTFGHTVDLIIGEHPGVIQLKERCVAFDRRYVQCIFQAPIIARAFKNGFPQLYSFTELNHQSYYRPMPRLIAITNEDYLIFHFYPRDRNEIPKRSLMSVNITIRKFGSSFYRFNLDPIHTTKVNFQMNDISCRQFRIDIDHNTTGTISSRLCSGHISQIDQDKTWTAVQDIAPTTDPKILIERLRSSTDYEVCLKCYYETDDLSFKEEHCRKTKTSPATTCYGVKSYILLGIISVIIGVVIGVIIFFYRKEKIKICSRRSKHSSKLSPSSSKHSITILPDNPYSPDPNEHVDGRSLISSSDDGLPLNRDQSSGQVRCNQYMSFEYLCDDVMKNFLSENKISMDTQDLSGPINT